MAEIEGLGERLVAYCASFLGWMRTRTRDTSHYGYEYVSGLLRLDSERTIANIGRQTDVNEQAMHHFISNSPWSAREVLDEVQRQVAARAEVHSGAVLILDESADEKAGQCSVGAARQYNGRRGKVEMSQVGVFVALAKDDFWTWVDGEVYLPQAWFGDAYVDKRLRAGIPPERAFLTKPELGWQMIERARANGLPFEAVACDTLYGRNTWLRDRMAGAGLEYYADVPANTRVYLSEPLIALPDNRPGRKAHKPRILSPKAMRVDQLRDQPDTAWQHVDIRPCERGILSADFATLPVWTVRDDLSVHPETLLIRRDARKHTYTLTNASPGTPLATLACRQSQRYFVERSNQDAKSEYGWDEFQATKLLAWEHQLALTIMAAWFIAQTKLDWAKQYAHDPALLEHYQVDVLPALSVANVRSLLCAALPLPQLQPGQAADLVVQHLVNRTRSRKSRLKNHPAHSGP